MSLPVWARAHGPSLFDAIIRQQPDDFRVVEKLGFSFSGDGEHDVVNIRKNGANTEWVARQLAQFAGIAERDIGYCGLKDRHAITEQWFSVPRWNTPMWEQFAAEGVAIINVARHHRKLRRGAHLGNDFQIVLRGATGDATAVVERLQTIREHGVPNYFGEQRFGRDGNNLQMVERWCKSRRLSRASRSRAISTARSYLFNDFLAARVASRTWNSLIVGDIANLDGSGSIFDVSEIDATLQARVSAFDIHPAGPLLGDGSDLALVPPDYAHWLDALCKARVKPMWRSLRLRALGLEWTILPDNLLIEFSLQRGGFATAVLREIGVVTNAAA